MAAYMKRKRLWALSNTPPRILDADRHPVKLAVPDDTCNFGQDGFNEGLYQTSLLDQLGSLQDEETVLA